MISLAASTALSPVPSRSGAPIAVMPGASGFVLPGIVGVDGQTDAAPGTALPVAGIAMGETMTALPASSPTLPMLDEAMAMPTPMPDIFVANTPSAGQRRLPDLPIISIALPADTRATLPTIAPRAFPVTEPMPASSPASPSEPAMAGAQTASATRPPSPPIIAVSVAPENQPPNAPVVVQGVTPPPDIYVPNAPATRPTAPPIISVASPGGMPTGQPAPTMPPTPASDTDKPDTPANDAVRPPAPPVVSLATMPWTPPVEHSASVPDISVPAAPVVPPTRATAPPIISVARAPDDLPIDTRAPALRPSAATDIFATDTPRQVARPVLPSLSPGSAAPLGTPVVEPMQTTQPPAPTTTRTGPDIILAACSQEYLIPPQPAAGTMPATGTAAGVQPSQTLSDEATSPRDVLAALRQRSSRSAARPINTGVREAAPPQAKTLQSADDARATDAGDRELIVLPAPLAPFVPVAGTYVVPDATTSNTTPVVPPLAASAAAPASAPVTVAIPSPAPAATSPAEPPSLGISAPQPATTSAAGMTMTPPPAAAALSPDVVPAPLPVPGNVAATIVPTLPVIAAAAAAIARIVPVVPTMPAAPTSPEASPPIVSDADVIPAAPAIVASALAQAQGPIAISTPTTASVVFGPAIAAAYEQDRRAAGNDPAATFDFLGAGMIATDRLAAAQPAPAAAQPATIDTSDVRWPAAMIARIETLRDAVDAADTRIRLLPDALGGIDVAVRRDGDTVHVHFTAEQSQTRTLIQEAAPRLAEAAEQRGIRLGQTSVDVGSSGAGSGAGSAPGGQGQPRQPAPEPRRPASAFTTGKPHVPTDPVDDARIA